MWQTSPFTATRPLCDAIFPAPFGAIPVDKLTSGDIETLLAAKTAAGLGTSLVSRVRRHLKQILDEGIRSGFVTNNTAAAARMPKERNHASERRALTADQAHALLAAVRGDRFECAFVLMLALALRKGEVLGLQWEDIDWYATPDPILHIGTPSSVNATPSGVNRPALCWVTSKAVDVARASSHSIRALSRRCSTTRSGRKPRGSVPIAGTRPAMSS